MAHRPFADLVFRGGRVWTGLAAAPPTAVVAVAGGRIVGVGSEAELADLVGPSTQAIDIGRGLLLPAFVDAHCHPLWGGMASMACDLSAGARPDEWLAIIERYAAANPALAVISGEGWDPYPFPDGRPRRDQLDAVVSDRPVVLVSRDGHSTWTNTAALDAAGISAATPDPPGGHIVRDAHGEPIGLFHEAAADLVQALIPEPDAELRAEGLRRGQSYLHGLGIGSWLDAIVEPVHEAVYLDLAARGELSGRVTLALRWDPARGLKQLDDLVARRQHIEDRGHWQLRAGAVKVFADGVVESSTAALLAPYTDGSATDPDGRGATTYSPGLLRQVCVALDAAGFDIHAHAIGDRATRYVLDGLEAARRLNAARDSRHALAHLELVDAGDIGRFAQLDAIADLQALWAVHDETDTILEPRLGVERLEARYPFGRLRDGGAALAMGSDWNVSTADPLHILHVATTRTPVGDPSARPLGPTSERLDLGQALSAYTLGSARVLRREDAIGTIEVGKAADLTLLDEDPFRQDLGPSDCRVRLTMVAGRVVYEAA